ncbi:hypothetical protein cce_2650 [Crocosphaera subtropica ATCC 51142]|uniref:Uncharacterized protein n=1 Tax=Crocosphaera subtropica (strain ATCC 51142 / BH68) TaxID=43989 RepID=B1WT76_CROS5|nr:hypothetical protein [Crocosphaera subtropica]ACB51998.1 hypothetical protein cce_2650 [Crocosphaera subtropica ATCC 51142]
MFLVIVVLFFFVVSWFAAYTLVIIPIHLLSSLGSLLNLSLLIMVLLLFTWFFGD